MKYQPPFGSDQPDQAYIDGDASIAREGSIVPAKSIEYPQREIVNFIAKSAITPSDGDLFQLLRSARDQFVNWAVDTGSANALSVALDPALTGYKQGFPIRVLVGNTNTGAATININNLGARPIKRANGADLVAGDIVAGGIALLVDDGTRFQIVNFLGAVGGTTNNFFFDIPYAEDSSVSPNTVTAVFSPAITAPLAGDVILVKLANANTGAVNINVNALGTLPIRRTDGQPLQARDHDTVGEVILLEYHNTYWQMMRLVRSQVFFKLSANLTLYVRTDGNDANDGSSNDAAHAFLHIQAAIDYVKNSFLIAGRTVTIQLGVAGTYTGAVNIGNIPGSIILSGDLNNRANYIVQFNPNSVDQSVFTASGSGIDVVVVGLTFYNMGTVWSTATVSYFAQVHFHDVRFSGVGTTSAFDIACFGGLVTLSSFVDFWRNNYVSISIMNGGRLTIGTWFTMLTFNSINSTYSVVNSDGGSAMNVDSASCGRSGAAFGRRYTATMNSVINTRGGGETFFPGSVAGLVDASSVYG